MKRVTWLAAGLAFLSLTAAGTAAEPGRSLPTPYTAAELRAEMVPGWRIVVRRQAEGAERTVRETWTVVAWDRDGCTIRFENEAGEAAERRFGWEELRGHARFPAEAASRREAEADTALGRVRGWVYTITGEDGAVTEMVFARDLPGPPVRIEEVRDGRRRVVFEQVGRRLLTPAEAVGYRATPSLDVTLAYLERLGRAWGGIRLERFGTSPQGRPMVAAVVSADGVFTAEGAARRGLPVVMVQNGIHAGEIDGKDASLALLRDMAEGRRRGLARGLVLVVVPVYNVDGHERVSPYNRANQAGPEAGMGFRTTAQGLDLNRDLLRADAPETRALLELVARWRPALHVDTHVTDGVRHGWVVTTTWTEAPLLDPSLDAWVRPRLAAATEATAAAGFPAGPWVDLEDPGDPARGFASLVAEPRYTTGYFPLRGIASILVEMHAYAPFRRRVRALEAFLAALLREVAGDPAGLLAASREAARREVELGAPEAPPSTVVVRWERDPEPDTVRWPACAWHTEDSVVTGRPMPLYDCSQVRELEVPWWHRLRPALELPRPAAYAVLPGWPAIEERLAAHGLEVERLAEAREVEGERLEVASPRFAPRPYQGRTRVEELEVRRVRERLTLPAGTLWIPAAQPAFEVAVQLLEPEAPDSLVRWGFLSTVFERKEYIDPRTLERIARERLRDPETARAWREALRDPELAGDARARYLWWYRRTPYWEVQEVGRLPVIRVLRAATWESGAAAGVSNHEGGGT